MTLVADFVTGQPVPFQRLRQLFLDQGGGLQEGVLNAGDLDVAQRGAGANMSVDVPAGSAWVAIDTGTRNGLAHIISDATSNVVVSASHLSLPRLDQIVLRYNDTTIPTGSGNIPTFEVVAGTATSGATLDNRNGAVALPNDCMRLADVLVPAASSTVVTANIRDRRPWARGAYSVVRIFSNVTDATGTHQTWTAGAMRIECSGKPLRIALQSNGQNSAAGASAIMGIRRDGAQIDSTGDMIGTTSAAANQSNVLAAEYVHFPAAGSYVFAPSYRQVGGGTATIIAGVTNPTVFTVFEEVRPNANNS
jgi:hypothetical protein